MNIDDAAFAAYEGCEVVVQLRPPPPFKAGERVVLALPYSYRRGPARIGKSSGQEWPPLVTYPAGTIATVVEASEGFEGALLRVDDDAFGYVPFEHLRALPEGA